MVFKSRNSIFKRDYIKVVKLSSAIYEKVISKTTVVNVDRRRVT